MSGVLRFSFGPDQVVLTAAVELYQICEMKAKILVLKFPLQYFSF
jgi:hypothetical protein